MDFGEDVPPEFEADIPKDTYIPREIMKQYLNAIEEKVHCFFESLTDTDLGKEIIPNAENYTYMDIIVSQNRHVMYNIGYLNGILRTLGLSESDWWAYNE